MTTRDALERFALIALGKRIVTIPSTWKTVALYDALVTQGLAEPVVNVGPWARGYQITEAGRTRLRERAEMEKP